MINKHISMRQRKIIGKVVATVLLSIFTVIYMFPLIWTVMFSFKTKIDALAYPPKIFSAFTFQNYFEVWSNSDFLQYTKNSLLIALSSCAIGMILGVPAAYILSRPMYKPKGSKYLLFGVLSTRIVPQITFMIPFFIIFRKLHF